MKVILKNVSSVHTDLDKYICEEDGSVYVYLDLLIGPENENGVELFNASL
ncbi:hypothetical protein [Lonepinella sp. MS14436]